jgi:HD-like signal output (HDOD) protein
MGKQERRAYLEAIRTRYRRARKAGKTAILNEFCAVCGYHRKYALRLLCTSGKRSKPAVGKPGPASRYAVPELIEALRTIWMASDQLCSKRLKAALPLWLPHYETGFKPLSVETRALLDGISAATIDRLLKPARAQAGRRGLSGTKPGTLLKKHIPIQTAVWDITQPGFIEADTVAHCGDSLAGDFVWSLTMTDLCTGWTECRATWNKGAQGVMTQIQPSPAFLQPSADQLSDRAGLAGDEHHIDGARGTGTTGNTGLSRGVQGMPLYKLRVLSRFLGGNGRGSFAGGADFFGFFAQYFQISKPHLQGGPMSQQAKSMKDLLTFMGRADIPVLKQTARQLESLRADETLLNARGIANVVTDDPLMTVKLLRYMQTHKHRNQKYELVDVTQTLLMMGLDTFFREVPANPVAEVMLHDQLDALVHLLHTVRRAQCAAHYAFDWALRLHDLHAEEVFVSALLSHVAEMLMWCFNPLQMLEIRKRQEIDKTLRSADVQKQVLGFTGMDLQRQLAIEWKLPELLLDLMDPAKAKTARVRNVILAVNVARHSSQDWDNAALPDDYREIAMLLRMEPDKVMALVKAGPAVEQR